jgi:luciferase family oxidoreductase group 1
LSADDFPEQLSELVDYFTPKAHSPIRAVPAEGNRPPVWLLGSSGYSAQLAGMLGMPFAFAHHFSAQNTLPALKLYRENFRPSAELAKPYAMVAASVIAADTDEQAQFLAGSGALSFLRLRSGRPGLVPRPEEAAEYPFTPMERHFFEERLSSQIIGSPETVERGIEKLLAETEADELMIVTMVHDPAARTHSFDLVAALR